MGRPIIDVTGEVFGRLTVLGRAPTHVQPSGYRAAMWLCRCECGGEVGVRGNHLRSGFTTSCGKGECRFMFGRSGESSPTWIGAEVAYLGAHERVYAAKGKASEHLCVDTGEPALDWSLRHDADPANLRRETHGANEGKVYSLDVDDYEPRSRLAHKRYDNAHPTPIPASEHVEISLAA